MKMLGSKTERCPFGCCRSVGENSKGRHAEVRTMKRRERNNFKRDLVKGLL